MLGTAPESGQRARVSLRSTGRGGHVLNGNVQQIEGAKVLLEILHPVPAGSRRTRRCGWCAASQEGKSWQDDTRQSQKVFKTGDAR